MNWKYCCSAALVVGLSGPALAESLDRNALPLDMLWESGNSVRLSFTFPKPDVSASPVGGSGSVLNSYVTYGFAYKQELNDRLDLGLFVNQPYGADGGYTGGFLDGYSLDVQSSEIAAVLKYKFDNNVSVYGGLRAVKTELDLTLPGSLVPGGYTLNTGSDIGFGYLVGAAIEFPERAARVGLTYHSKIKHSFDSTEFGTTTFGQTEATLPQSLTLDGRTALNSKTLLFGSLKWADYSEFDVAAPGFGTLVVPGTSVIDYSTDSITANIGLGRKINDEWSVFGILDWTKSDGKASSLRPYDGATALTLGANYETGQIKVTGGVQYKKFRDATTALASYSGSSAVTPFLQIGYSF